MTDLPTKTTNKTTTKPGMDAYLENVPNEEEEPFLRESTHVQPRLTHEGHTELLLQVLLLCRNLNGRKEYTKVTWMYKHNRIRRIGM